MRRLPCFIKIEIRIVGEDVDDVGAGGVSCDRDRYQDADGDQLTQRRRGTEAQRGYGKFVRSQLEMGAIFGHDAGPVV